MRIVKSLPTDARPRIVEMLEELLERARKGEVTGICLFAEFSNGRWEHSRDGMPDERVCFALDVTRKRLLEKYE